MTEEIKKEMKNKSTQVENEVYCIDLYDVFEILDRYKDKEIKFEDEHKKFVRMFLKDKGGDE